MIETFEGEWEKAWFTCRFEDWARKTHKLYDPQWHAPAHAKLALEVRSVHPNTLVVGMDQYAAEVSVTGSDTWQYVVLVPADFKNAGTAMPQWTESKELRLGARETLRSKNNGKEQAVTLGADWQGETPKFRNLRWVTE